MGPRDKPEDDICWTVAATQTALMARNEPDTRLRGFFLTHPRATHSTVILGLVPRTQPSAREKRWEGSNTGQLDVI